MASKQPKPAKANPCSRTVLEQWQTQHSGARRGDHRLRRLDLLSDDDLDDYRRRFPEAAQALETHDELEAEMDRRMCELLRDRSVERLERTLAGRPVLVVVVCVQCGAHEAVQAWRDWELDHAMRRTGRAERDLLNAAARHEDDPAHHA